MADTNGLILTSRGRIEISAESAANSWIVEISKDGSRRLLQNMKEIPAFPLSPLTKSVIAIADSIQVDAVRYLAKSWEQGKPWDDAEGRAAWWEMKEKVRNY